MGKEGALLLKLSNSSRRISLADVGAVAFAWQQAQAEESAVVVTGARGAIYEDVVNAIDALRKAGVKRVGVAQAG